MAKSMEFTDNLSQNMDMMLSALQNLKQAREESNTYSGITNE